MLYTDADLPCELVEADKALRLMRLYEADLVSAYRFDRTSEGAQRAVYSYVYNHLVRWVLGARIRDVNFAFKLIRRRVLDHVELRSEGSFIDAELMAKAHRRGSATQFGVDYIATRGTSTLSSPAVIGIGWSSPPCTPRSAGSTGCPSPCSRASRRDPAPAGALRVLIVNADDFGLTPAVSRGILRFTGRAS